MCLDYLIYTFLLFLTNQCQIPKPCVEMITISLALHAEIPQVRALLTSQCLIFRRYREPASENVTSQREKEIRQIVTSERSTRNTSTQLSDR